MSTSRGLEELEAAGSTEEHGPREEPPASGISFTFQRKAAGKKPAKREGEGDRDFVVSLEGREIQR